jgi:hypothetical protein
MRPTRRRNPMRTMDRQTPQAFAMTQVVMPRWMQEVVDEAMAEGREVDVTRVVTPVGTFVESVEVAR